MKKLGWRLGVAALGMLVAASAAYADTPGVTRKKSFFDDLFGGGNRSGLILRKKRRVIFGDDWWNESSRGGVRVINGRDLSYTINDGSDPEIPTGYGMGNLTYVPENLVALGGTAPKDVRPDWGIAAEIYDALASPDLGIKVQAEERQAILSHYSQTGFRPLWIENGKLSPRAAAILKIFEQAADEGLQPANYLPPALNNYAGLSSAAASDGKTLARLDLGITAMALKYARHASGGQFNPRKLSRYNDITPEGVAPSQAIKVIAWSPFADSYLRDLQPKHPAYAAMKTALAELRKEADGTRATTIATGPQVKIGQSDARIAQLRQRLRELGYDVAIPDSLLDETVFDATLSATLKQFQKASGVKPTGILGAATVKALNSHGSERDELRLVDNMERLRWLPKNLGSKYVLVNQAAFQVQVIDKGTEVWRSKVIVGKPMTQTSAFHDQIETVVFNPAWGVPPSIIANEYLPILRGDPAYLDRIGFKVTDNYGQEIPSSYIDWWSYGNRVPFSIQQPPGRTNALGELKFLFPNSHDIYMHDTPNRGLFNKEVRAFSHGCVRVQNPREFAAVLLGWDPKKIAKTVEGKVSQTVALPAKVPVHITYFTAWPDETGKIQYFNDLYGRDKAMENALSAMTVAER